MVDYDEARLFQEVVHHARLRELVPDTLILLQHPPVFTLGRAGKEHNVLAPQSMLEREGIRVIKTDRGGDITYHGPGQLVIYPILKLASFGNDVHDYVRRLEQSVIDLLSEYGITAQRNAGYPGVWVGQTKIAAIGVAIRGGITKHGMALNVDPNLAHFRMINPCGLGKPVTSMAQELNRPVDVHEVQRRYVSSFAKVFDLEPSERLVESVAEYAEELTAVVDGSSPEYR
jgi:lipoate-protein ligase B